jgi:hypothetical protein
VNLGPAKAVTAQSEATSIDDHEYFPLTQEDIEALLQPDDELDSLPTERGTAPIFSKCNLSNANRPINIVIRKLFAMASSACHAYEYQPALPGIDPKFCRT